MPLLFQARDLPHQIIDFSALKSIEITVRLVFYPPFFPDFPLRCEVGDMSGKHGRLSVGGKAFVFNDGHLPLSGDWFQSALGKSVVVHVPDGGGERMACANIEEERDIVKQVRWDSTF